MQDRYRQKIAQVCHEYCHTPACHLVAADSNRSFRLWWKQHKNASPEVTDPGYRNVNTQRLRVADEQPGNWYTNGRDFGKSYYSPLDQVNSVPGMMNVIANLTIEDTGRFFKHNGETPPWYLSFRSPQRAL